MASVAGVSGARRKILNALLVSERTIPELSELLGFHPATVRYHLGVLVHHGAVEEQIAEARGGRGRPATRYRISRHAYVAGFPPRHYELLAEVALRTLLEVEGLSSARRLRGQGARLGNSMVEEAAKQGEIPRWSPEEFERRILGDLYGRFGVVTEVTDRREDALTYRSLTCPFLELAERIPILVCDALDLGFHDGVDQAVGGKTRRLACMGHGDSFCEYRTSWTPTSSETGGPPTAGARRRMTEKVES